MLTNIRKFKELPIEEQEYLLENLPNHLDKAKLYSELYSLISKQWFDLKIGHGLTFQQFSQDVEIAIEAARTEVPVNWVELLRNSLIRTTLSSIANNITSRIVGVLAQQGQLEKALGYSALMSGYLDQSASYRMIANVAFKEKNFELAKELVEKGYSVARMSSDSDRYYSKSMELIEIAEVLVNLGENKQAIAITTGVLARLDSIRDFDLQYLFEVDLSNSKELDKGQLSSKLTEEFKAYGHALSEDAHVKVELVMDTWLIFDARDQYMVQKENQILKVYSVDSQKETRIELQIKVAQTLLGADQINQSFEIIESLIDSLAYMEYHYDTSNIAYILTNTLKTLTSVEQRQMSQIVNRAVSTINKIKKDVDKAGALSELSRALALVGNISLAEKYANDALGLIKNTEDTLNWARIIGTVSETLHLIGNHFIALNALEIANSIITSQKTSRIGVLALCAIATALIRINETTSALDLVNRLVIILSEFSGPQYHLRSSVAEILIQIGKFDEAIAIANEIQDYFVKERILSSAAIAMVNLGEIDNAISLIDKFQERYQQRQVLSQAAYLLTQKDEIANSIRIVNYYFQLVETTSHYTLYKVNGLTELAQILISGEKIDKAATVANYALSTARNSEPLAAKIEAIFNVAFALANANAKQSANKVFEEAMALVSQINDEFTKKIVLAYAVKPLSIIRAHQIDDLVTNLLSTMGMPNRVLDEWFTVLTYEPGVEAEGSNDFKAFCLNEWLIQLASINDKHNTVRVADAMVQILKAIQHEIVIDAATLNVIETDRDLSDLTNSADVQHIGSIAWALWTVGERSHEASEFTIFVDQAINSIDDEYLQVTTLCNLAIATCDADTTPRGIYYIERALMITNETVDKVLQCQLFSLIGRKLVSIGEINRAIEVIDKIDIESASISLISEVAFVYHEAGLRDQALDNLCKALFKASTNDNSSLFSVITQCTNLLGSIDNYKTLIRFYDAIIEIDGWWD